MQDICFLFKNIQSKNHDDFQQHKNTFENSRKDYQNELEKIQKNAEKEKLILKNEIAFLTDSHQHELENMNDNMRKILVDRDQQESKKISDLLEQNNINIDEIKSNLLENFDKEKKAMNIKYENDIQKILGDKKLEIDMIKTDFQVQISELKTQNEINLKISDDNQRNYKDQQTYMKERCDEEIKSLKIEIKEELKYERSKSESYMRQINEMLKIIEAKEGQIRTLQTTNNHQNSIQGHSEENNPNNQNFNKFAMTNPTNFSFGKTLNNWNKPFEANSNQKGYYKTSDSKFYNPKEKNIVNNFDLNNIYNQQPNINTKNFENPNELGRDSVHSNNRGFRDTLGGNSISSNNNESLQERIKEIEKKYNDELFSDI